MKNLKNKFAICGFMGVGKSTLHQKFKEHYPSFDLDSLIEKDLGLRINQFLENNNVNQFRELEYQTLLMLPKENHLLFPGGGVLEYEKSRNYLLEHYITIFINEDIDTILPRINSKERPLLKNPKELLLSRLENYLKCSMKINCTDSVDEKFRKISEVINE